MGLVISNYGLFLVLGGRGLRVKPVVKENSSNPVRTPYNIQLSIKFQWGC